MGHQGGISYMKGGIQFSEMVTTVSPQYAREIQGGEMGYGLDGTLRGRAPTSSASSTASTTASGIRETTRTSWRPTRPTTSPARRSAGAIS
mgnify:CR=1 FL=1